MDTDKEAKTGEEGIGLRTALLDHRGSLVNHLAANTLFLTYLAKHRILHAGDILKYEAYTDERKRNADVIDSIIGKDGQDGEQDSSDTERLSKFLDALKKSGQDNIVSMMTNVHQELDLVDKYQGNLEAHLKTIDSFLAKESRRAAIKFKDEPIDEIEDEIPPVKRDGDNETLTDFLYKVHQTTKSTLIKFDRCKEVIGKLHNDCDNVAQKNSEMLDKLRECEDVVLEMTPLHLQQNTTGKGERDIETNRSRASSRASYDDTMTLLGGPKLKMTEAEKLLFSIRGHLGQIGDYLKQADVDREGCFKIIDMMTDEIKERRGFLGRAAEAPIARPVNTKYANNLPPIKVTGLTNFRSQLRPKLELFADRFQDYVQHESQVTHKMNINKYQAGMAHRQFDELDGDLAQLQREMRRNDRDRAMVVTKRVVDVTKAEREDCLRIVEEVERSVRSRRQKVQEMNQKDKTRARRKRPHYQRVRFIKKVDSNFSKRLNDLNNEVRLYIDSETDQLKTVHSELDKRKQEFETQAKGKQTEIKSLENKLRLMTTDRDKFKLLYNKEKTMVKTKIITKPTIPKRDVSRPGPLPPIKQTGPSRRSLMSVTGTRTGRSTTSSVTSTRADTSTTRVRTRPVMVVKPRLTPRARDLKGLKDNLKAKKKMALIKPLNLIPETEQELEVAGI